MSKSSFSHPKTASLALWLALAALACGGPQKSSTIGTGGTGRPGGNGTAQGSGTPVEPGTSSLTAFVQAGATSDTEDDAYLTAVHELEVALYDSEDWANFLDLPVHEPERDPMQTSNEEGRARVDVGLDKERVAELLDQVAQHEWQTTLPAPFASTIQQAYRLELERMLCERRQALFQETCTPPASNAAVAQVKALASEIRLRPLYTGGVPTNAEGKPLRPVRIVAERVANGVRAPLAGVPVLLGQAQSPDAPAAGQPAAAAADVGPIEALSDAGGIATLKLPEGVPWPVHVTLDRERLLGPLASLWPAVELELGTRKITASRWSVLTTERVQGQNAGEAVFAASLAKAMRTRGAGTLVVVPEDSMRKLKGASADALARMLPAMADTWEGRVDVLLVGELDSEFASRMGQHRVWYEARGRVDVYDVWTGQKLTTIEDAVTATGVGDDRADRAARAQLAEKLADKLVQVTKPQP